MRNVNYIIKNYGRGSKSTTAFAFGGSFEITTIVTGVVKLYYTIGMSPQCVL
jgi:hypothetical protein